MSKNKNKIILMASIIMIGSISLFLFYIIQKESPKHNSIEAEEEQINSGDEDPALELSAWVVDWQSDAGIDDLEILVNNLTSIQVFAAYFDHEEKLLFTENLDNMVEYLEQNVELNAAYLTIVNDKIQIDGTSVQKDPDLISHLVGTEDQRKQHIDEIIDAVHTYDVEGVEIDYEKIKDGDWGNMIAFYTELYNRLIQIDKKLRIVLEPSIPIERLSFPTGPVYVMMAYNLYGYHTGPGPKADQELIIQVANKVKGLPGDNYIALSTGGFDWREDGKITSLTEESAKKLIARSSNPSKRDEKSGGINFNYTDDAALSHTVWYADQETLQHWIGTAREAGINRVALWRLGGLESNTLNYFSEEK